MLWIKIWDFLLWIFVAFPLITGGIWFRNGKIEFTQITIPVVVLGIFAVILFYYKNISIEGASSVRLFKKLWQKWLLLLDIKPKRTLFAVMCVFSALWFVASLRRHYAFSSGAADLGIFTNALWNLSHGNGYFSSVKGGINLFADHQSPILC